jgi:hypothetical protein
MLPSPYIPLHEYEVRHASHVAHVRAALAAVVIFVVCVFVMAAHL